MNDAELRAAWTTPEIIDLGEAEEAKAGHNGRMDMGGLHNNGHS